MSIAFDTILVPYDFSAHAAHALEVGADLAKRFGSKLHLFHTVQPPTFAMTEPALAGGAAPLVDVRAWEKEAADRLTRVANELDAADPGIDVHVVTLGAIDRAIRAYAEAIAADLIVMGTHGRTGFAHVFLGSVTERTLRDAPCPVLAVRSEEEDPS